MIRSATSARGLWLVGSTGCGKTLLLHLLAKALDVELFPNTIPRRKRPKKRILVTYDDIDGGACKRKLAKRQELSMEMQDKQVILVAVTSCRPLNEILRPSCVSWVQRTMLVVDMNACPFGKMLCCAETHEKKGEIVNWMEEHIKDLCARLSAWRMDPKGTVAAECMREQGDFDQDGNHQDGNQNESSWPTSRDILLVVQMALVPFTRIPSVSLACEREQQSEMFKRNTAFLGNQISLRKGD